MSTKDTRLMCRSSMTLAYVEGLCKRIQSFLPHRTGASIAEIELNPQFQRATEIVIANIQTPYFVSHFLEAMVTIINGIIHESSSTSSTAPSTPATATPPTSHFPAIHGLLPPLASHARLADTDDKSIASVAVVLKLMAQVVGANWSRHSSRVPLEVRFDLLSTLDNFRSFSTPDQLAASTVSSTLDALFRLLSPQFTLDILYEVRGRRDLPDALLKGFASPSSGRPQLPAPQSHTNLAHKMSTSSIASSLTTTTSATAAGTPVTPAAGASTPAVVAAAQVASTLKDNASLAPSILSSTMATTSTATGATNTVSSHQIYHQQITSPTASVSSHPQLPTSTHDSTPNSPLVSPVAKRVAPSTPASRSRPLGHSSTSHHVLARHAVHLNSPLEKSTSTVSSSTTPVDSTPNQILLAQIDAHIDTILRYVAAANPDDYYLYLRSKLFIYSEREEIIPMPNVQLYTQLLRFMFFTRPVLKKVLKGLFSSLPYVKSNTWRLTILMFFTTSLRDQCYARPQDYLNFTNRNIDTDLELSFVSLFDFMSYVFETVHRNLAGVLIQTWLVMFCTGDILEVAEKKKPSRFKKNFNKRIRFLYLMTRELDELELLDPVHSMVNMVNLVGRFPKTTDAKNHPLHKFVDNYMGEIFLGLAQLQAMSTEKWSSSIDTLTVNFLVGVLLLLPEDIVTTSFLKTFHEGRHSLRVIEITLKIMLGLANTPQARSVLHSVLQPLTLELLTILTGCIKILNLNNKNTHKLNHSSCERYCLENPNFNFDSVNSFGSTLDVYYDELLNYMKSHHSNSDTASVSTSSTNRSIFSTRDKAEVKKSSSNTSSKQKAVSPPTLQTELGSSLSSLMNALVANTGGRCATTITSDEQKDRLVTEVEQIFTNLLAVYINCPNSYYYSKSLMGEGTVPDYTDPQLRADIEEYIRGKVLPFKFAFVYHPLRGDSKLFDVAMSMSLSFVLPESVETIRKSPGAFLSYYSISNLVIQAIAEVCFSVSLSDPKFKNCLMFVNELLQKRQALKVLHTSFDTHLYPSYFDICPSIEKALVLSLCNSDILYYNLSKTVMRIHIEELDLFESYGFPINRSETLADVFRSLVENDAVYTGYVSLHKRIRRHLRQATATSSLYEAWVLIFHRWLDVLDNRTSVLSNSTEEGLVFRNYSGFLAATCGCFLLEEFAALQPHRFEEARANIADFIDRCIRMLTSSDLVIRVVIKDALASESHALVYDMICTKLSEFCEQFLNAAVVNDEVVLFTEQTLVILTNFVINLNLGSFYVISLFPTVMSHLVKFVSLIDLIQDSARIKLRFCKLIHALESARDELALNGLLKLRCHFAKYVCEWLENAVFFDEIGLGSSVGMLTSSSASIQSNSSSRNDSGLANSIHSVGSNPPATPAVSSAIVSKFKDSEIVYLNIDVANECVKTLSLILERLILQVPENTKDKDLRKYKDFAFGNFFSLFYKILQKYTGRELSPVLMRSKYKINQIIDNVLKCISNMLQTNGDVGMQFVLPLGYHDNDKIRSIFLNVFAQNINTRMNNEESSNSYENLFNQLSELVDMMGAIAEVASPTEHTLLASSMFSIYNYKNMTSELLQVLLSKEITYVSRSTDIFRRNSTLTRLLYMFARNTGSSYLDATVKPFIQELNDNDVAIEIEKPRDSYEPDADLFMYFLTTLVDKIIDSLDLMPNILKVVSRQIYLTVEAKFPEAALIAVGSFIFLRFLCPVIISPEAYLEEVTVTNPKVKRTLMQLVKILQNMANGTLDLFKFPGLIDKMKEMEELNNKVQFFLVQVSSTDLPDDEVLFPQTEPPIAELRFLHRFFYTYVAQIRKEYLSDASNVQKSEFQAKIRNCKKLDNILWEWGEPREMMKFQITNPYKILDPNQGLTQDFNNFMSKMSQKYIDTSLDIPLVHNAFSKDGTPVVVINLNFLKEFNFDVSFLVYKMFETVSQFWDSKFNFTFDFTEAIAPRNLIESYTEQVKKFAPMPFFTNCSRINYFNLPRALLPLILAATTTNRNDDFLSKLHFYSLLDSLEVLEDIGIDPSTISIARDVRVEFKELLCFEANGVARHVGINIGRTWLRVADEEPTETSMAATPDFKGVSVYRLLDISKCEIAKEKGNEDEFTVFVNDDVPITFRSKERDEILKYLYFATSRIPKKFGSDFGKGVNHNGDDNEMWLGTLVNIAFHGLLLSTMDVRTAAQALFASLMEFLDVDLGIGIDTAPSLQFPLDTTDYVVGISQFLAKSHPELTYGMLTAFFHDYEKLPRELRLSANLYIAPWIENICSEILLQDEVNGPDKVAEFARQFCRITAFNIEKLSIIKEILWKKLFSIPRLTLILIDEVVAFALDKKDSDTEWSSIISVIPPSYETCSKVLNRLIHCIQETDKGDSAIASQSKLMEITLLVRISSSLFFDSYKYAQLHLPDVFFIISLFIDSIHVDVGADLQGLLINVIQSFVQKPDLTADELSTIDSTVVYFSSQRAKMFFGLTTEAKASKTDPNQMYNKANMLEAVCDHFDNFITVFRKSDDRSGWRARWCGNAVDLAFNRRSIFQSRALLIVGIISRNGVADSTTARWLKLISSMEIKKLETATTVTLASARLYNGLEQNTGLASVLVWPYLALTLVNTPVLYQPAVQCFTAVLCNAIGAQKDYVDEIIRAKRILEPHISEFENSYQLEITAENFGAHVFYIMTMGFKYSHIRPTCLECVKQYFSLRYSLRERTPVFGDNIYDNCVAYVVFIYLCLTKGEFEEYCDSIGLTTELVAIDENLKLPKVVTDFAHKVEPALFILIYIADLLKGDVDPVFKLKFVEFYYYVMKTVPQAALMVYHLLAPTMESYLASTSIDNLDMISEIMLFVVGSKDYDYKANDRAVQQVLSKHNVGILRCPLFRPFNFRDMRVVQEMIYRGACSYAEGNRLEN